MKFATIRRLRYLWSSIRFEKPDFWSILIDFDQFWSILIDFDRFWSIFVAFDHFLSILPLFGVPLNQNGSLLVCRNRFLSILAILDNFENPISGIWTEYEWICEFWGPVKLKRVPFGLKNRFFVTSEDFDDF